MKDWLPILWCVLVAAAFAAGVSIGSIDSADAMNCIPMAPVGWEA